MLGKWSTKCQNNIMYNVSKCAMIHTLLTKQPNFMYTLLRLNLEVLDSSVKMSIQQHVKEAKSIILRIIGTEIELS